MFVLVAPLRSPFIYIEAPSGSDLATNIPLAKNLKLSISKRYPLAKSAAKYPTTDTKMMVKNRKNTRTLVMALQIILLLYNAF